MHVVEQPPITSARSRFNASYTVASTDSVDSLAIALSSFRVSRSEGYLSHAFRSLALSSINFWCTALLVTLSGTLTILRIPPALPERRDVAYTVARSLAAADAFQPLNHIDRAFSSYSSFNLRRSPAPTGSPAMQAGTVVQTAHLLVYDASCDSAQWSAPILVYLADLAPFFAMRSDHATTRVSPTRLRRISRLEGRMHPAPWNTPVWLVLGGC